MRKCKVCKSPFQPRQSIQPTCDSFDCKIAYAEQAAAKNADKRAKQERRDIAVRRERLETLPELTKKAQAAFNEYIRERDKHKPCICCGKPLTLDAVGGGYDCGHYRSTGSAPHLRFHEDNAHGQRKFCNRYGSGRAVDYRIGLIARIGLARVEALEADNSPRKYTREQLIQMAKDYRKKARELK